MRECRYEIKEQYGLHARNAAALAMLCRKLKSETLVHCKGMTVDAKNPIELLGLGASKGDILKLIVTGEDEDRAMELWKDYCENNL